jgi:hypothetical protein
MAIILNGTTGITTPDIDSTAGFDGEDLTGDVAAARITGALNATGSAPIYACRAWVNFDGTGAVAIRASGNVSSITDNGVGLYTVNFTTAMSDINYGISAMADGTYNGTICSVGHGDGDNTAMSTGNVRVESRGGDNSGGGARDATQYCVAIFR